MAASVAICRRCGVARTVRTSRAPTPFCKDCMGADRPYMKAIKSGQPLVPRRVS